MNASNEETDRVSYQTWQKVQQTVESSMDRTPSFWKYVLSAYLFYKSRLAVPGRAYDSDEHGMLAIGGSAHADVMDLELYIGRQSAETRTEAYDWTLDSSQEKVSEWRKMGHGISQQTVSRRRNRIVEDAAAAIGE